MTRAARPVGPSLPLPTPPSASQAGRSLDTSDHHWRQTPSPLPDDAPNIVVFMTDDAGFSNGSPFGGAINLPTMERVMNMGVSYNRFHTTAMCSPTRACVLTGRNHHAVGFGQIPEYATDFDGYVGEIPPSAATIADVLRGYGYGTAAFGKWHNTPVDHVNRNGPFGRWPTGHGFDYFYGFVAAETSQYEPRLFENTTPIEPPDRPGYHLTEDMAGSNNRLPAAPTKHCAGQTRLRILHPRCCPRTTPHSNRVGPTDMRACSTMAGKHCASAPSPASANSDGSPATPS